MVFKNKLEQKMNPKVNKQTDGYLRVGNSKKVLHYQKSADTKKKKPRPLAEMFANFL